MSVITKPGPYRERSGGKARVTMVDSETGFAFGYDSLNRATAWQCETGCANYGYSISGEWHDQPERAFRVSDHGCGIYETREGKQVSLVDKSGSETFPWRAKFGAIGYAAWGDDGRFYSDGKARPQDLVRYVGPLPQPAEQWTKTCDLRLRRVSDKPELPAVCVMWFDMKTNEWARRYYVQEQRYTCGDREEWRAIGTME